MNNRFYYNNEKRHNKISSSSTGRIGEISHQNKISNNNIKNNKKKNNNINSSFYINYSRCNCIININRKFKEEKREGRKYSINRKSI